MINFKERLEANDNRGTAMPMIILLQVKKTYVAHDEYNSGADTRYVEDLSGDYMQSGSKLYLIKRLLEHGHSKAEIRGQIREFQEGHYWETENVFFTDKGYEEHMALNRHNYRKGEVRSYGIHAWRNPELNEVYKILMANAGQTPQTLMAEN